MPAPSKKRILVVEDDHAVARMLAKVLEVDYEVTVAHDGAEGLEAARRMMPDLALLDVVLPSLDGFRLAEELGREPGLGQVPVIFLTAKDSPLDVLHGIQAGARHYLTKPFKLEQVRDKVAEVLR